MREIRGRVAVVTGAASGIGYAISARLGAEGAQLAVSDVDEDALSRAADALRSEGCIVYPIAADVSDAADVDRRADAVVDRFGRVNVLCNNAGVVAGGPIGDITSDEWRWVLEVDLWGVINGVRAFLPIIERQDDGHIQATASMSALAAPAMHAPSAVAKAGVVALMESLRRELDDRHPSIGASVICPGPVRTSLFASSQRFAAALANRSSTDAAAVFARQSSEMLASAGISPAIVAHRAIQGIQDGRFWILTHDAWTDMIRERCEAMLTGGRLTSRPTAKAILGSTQSEADGFDEHRAASGRASCDQPRARRHRCRRGARPARDPSQSQSGWSNGLVGRRPGDTRLPSDRRGLVGRRHALRRRTPP
jgi:NAD(P)-dependent dehydrogenase (short-subunit alcohol dehydrogenase family)